MRFMRRSIIILIFFSVCCLVATAQKHDNLKNATWIRIMQGDTTVNYFTAKKDFAKFAAQHRKKEAQEEKERQSEKNTTRVPNEEHLRDPEENAIMAFERWSKSMRPFVKANGKVMSIDERMAAINRQK